MISPELALGGMREQLREVVLPALDDERARAVVIAALGILADLALQVREDDQWCRETVRQLHKALVRWRGKLPGGEVVLTRVDELVAQSEIASTPLAARRGLLDAATLVLRSLWKEGGQAQHGELLAELRRVLAIDLTHQLARSR
jgi:hypothetical protein